VVLKHSRPSRRVSLNTFTRRVSARQSTIQQNTINASTIDAITEEGSDKSKMDLLSQHIGAMHALRNEDSLMLTASQLDQMPDLQQIHLTRLNRAVANRLTGADKLLFNNDATAARSTSPGDNLGSASPVQQSLPDDDLLKAQLSKREAQDRLILHQLDMGLLPETFIKSCADANALTINLSKYGIGDARGLCLGKW
jgi:hypothetical protein